MPWKRYSLSIPKYFSINFGLAEIINCAINQVYASEDTVYSVEPNIVINGAANYQSSLNLPAAPTTIDANTYVAVIFRGILLQNCSSVK